MYVYTLSINIPKIFIFMYIYVYIYLQYRGLGREGLIHNCQTVEDYSCVCNISLILLNNGDDISAVIIPQKCCGLNTFINCIHN